MRAKQFRIGNLVSLNGKEFEVTLQSLYEGANLDWKPIQISKEILLRCGFREFNLGFRIHTDVYEEIEFNSVLFCWVNGTKKPIKYVHQLQNLYFDFDEGDTSLDIDEEEEPNLELHEQHEPVTESHEDGGE